jgi:predicted ATP-grasp superfamily ATP-dependent carboligase
MWPQQHGCMRHSAAGQGKRVLVLGDYRQTLTVVRSLARAGCEVILGTDDPRSSTALSRYVHDVWTYQSQCAKRFRDDLENWLRSEQPDFVFVVGESQLRRLMVEAARFAPLALWANAAFDTVARCFDKRSLYRLASELGVPTPPWRDFTSAGDWLRAAREIGYPVVIKRKDSSAQVQERKALICQSPAALEAFLAELRSDADPGSLVLQKFARGKRRNCHVAACAGELVAYFEQAVLRTDELDDTGIGVAGVSVAPTPQLRDHCERLTRALGYDGVGCIQFLIDEASGEIAFLEFNARMDSTAALPYRLGYDFPRLALVLAAMRSRGERATSFYAPYPAGKKYHWLYGDLYTWVEAARRGRLDAGELIRFALRIAWDASTSYHLTWDLLDPLPTLHQFSRRFIEPALRRFQPPSLRHV